MEAAAQAWANERLAAAEAADPALTYCMALARAGYEETLRAIGSYGTASGRGAPALFSEKHRDLLELTAFQLALHLLRPSEESLELLAELFPQSGAGIRRWVPRPVVDPPCGFGKTEAAKAVLTTSLRMHRKGRLGPGDYPGALFLTDELGQLDAVAVSLKTAGLRYGSDFGMYYDPPKDKERRKEILTPSIKEEDCPKVPILLICVQQLAARTKKERQCRNLKPAEGSDQVLVMANGQQRKLIIKDEVLLGVETYRFAIEDLELTAKTLDCHPSVRDDAELDDLREVLASVITSFSKAAEALTEPGQIVLAVMPPISEGMANQANAASNRLDQSDVAHRVLYGLSQIGGLVDLEVGVHFRSRETKKDGRIKDRIVMAKAVKTWPFDRVPEFITLDANYRADLITQSAKKHERSSLMRLVRCEPQELKRMHNLRLHVSSGMKGSKAQGGRGSLQNQKTRAAYISLIVRTLLPIYRDSTRRILIFTFKKVTSVNYRDEIRDALIESGIDKDHIHYGAHGLQPHHRVVLETWGRHVSTNAFVSCSAVFFLGVLRYQQEQLMYSSWGMADQPDMRPGDLPWSVAQLDRSMLVCHVVQAIYRTMARVTVDGMCPECDAYVILRDPEDNGFLLEQELRKLMGDFTLMPWEMATKKRERTATMADMIVATVLELMIENGRERVTFSEVKQRVMAAAGAKSAATWVKYRKEADQVLAEHQIVLSGQGAAAKAWVKPGQGGN